jgi:hypothetical protein
VALLTFPVPLGYGRPALTADDRLLIGTAVFEVTSPLRRSLRATPPAAGGVGILRVTGPPPVVVPVPAPTPTPTPTPGAAPVVTPAPRTCTSRRVITINLRTGLTARQRRTVKVRSVTVRIDGRTIAPASTRLRIRADLRGRPFGSSTVQASIRLSNGRTVTDRRVFRTCRDGQSDRLSPGYDA